MKKTLQIVLIIALVFSLAIPAVAYAASGVPTEVIEASNSVYKIEAEYNDGRASGTGFVISNDSKTILIATNHHVIEGNPIDIGVYVGRDDFIHATVLCSSKQKDLAVLKLASFIDAKPIAFAEEEAAKGDAVYAIGFPALADALSDTVSQTSEETTITDGIVSAIRKLSITEYGGQVTILQTNVDINHGNSGGPLLTSEGKVTGVNTYGISDASGIFGAVGVSELKTFLADNGISVSDGNTKTEKVLGVLWIGLAVALVVVAVLAFVLTKKKGPIKKNKTPTVSLRSYLMQYPNGLSVENTTDLLLPLAEQIRNRHAEGTVQLQLSPDTITVKDGQVSLALSQPGTGSVFFSGFTAPEVYKGVTSDKASDIYSFAAVYSYVLTGTTPENALTRTDNSLPITLSSANETIKGILEKALALNPEERFESADEIIEALKPYARIPEATAAEATVDTPAQEKPEKSVHKMSLPKKYRKLLIPVTLLLILCILCGVHFVKYSKAKTYALNGDFAGAEESMPIRAITALHDPKFNDYISAGLSRRDRNFEKAYDEFAALGTYLNAEQLSLDCLADEAQQLVNKNEFDKAFEIYDILQEENYPDVIHLKNAALYRKGIYLLRECEDFEMAKEIFQELDEAGYDGAKEMLNEVSYWWALSYANKEDYLNAYKKMLEIKGYSDSKELIDALEELVYLQGIDYYRKGDYTNASKYFNALSKNYERVADYITLLGVRKTPILYYTDREIKSSVIQLIGFEDMNELILSRDEMACAFLFGTWKTANGSNFFKITYDDGYHAGYDLPRIDFGQSYSIENGFYLKHDQNTNKEQKQFMITILSYDCIQIYAYKDGSSYTMYRQ